MANTGESYGTTLEVYDSGGILIGTFANVAEDITAQELSELTGGLLDISLAQNALANRVKIDAVNCKACLDPLPVNEFYAEILEENENSFYLQPDGSNACKTYLYA